MTGNPKVSVIVPVYNVEDYLESCLESVVGQTLTEIEIVTVNDGSTDGSLKILERYASRDPRIVLIDQQNMGLSGARNSGIEVAQGDYILFLDSDDTIEKETLEELLSFIEKEHLDIVVFGYTKIHENGKIIAKPDFGNKILDQDTARREAIALRLSPMACNKMYKSVLFENTKIRYPIGFLHEDIGTTYKLFWNASSVGTVSKSYYNWKVRGDSITSGLTKKHIEDVMYLLNEKKKFLIENDRFESFDTEYIRAFFQMKTLLLERAMVASSVENNLVDFLLERSKVQGIDSEQQMKMFNAYDPKLYRKHNVFLEKAKKMNIALLHEKIDILKKELSSSEKEHAGDMHVKKYQMTDYYEVIRDTVFPIGSRQRELVKRLKHIVRKGEL